MSRWSKALPLALVLYAAGARADETPTRQPTLPPATFTENTISVQPITKDGEKLNFYTDTGGGLFLLKTSATRLGLAVVPAQGDDPAFAELPAFKPEADIPLLERLGRKLPVYHPEEPGPMPGFLKTADGMLGQEWFGGRVWTFDYPGKQLLLRPAGDVPQAEGSHKVRLGFRTDAAGKREADFPRIQVSIDGETLDLLFDTGAMTEVSDPALESLADGRGACRATSFITATVFHRWKQRHPDWRVIEKAETSTDEPMIEVPEMVVGGTTVGPVWFTRRADRNFHVYMSQFMDQPIEGALGGSAFQELRITVDYPNAIAVFEKPEP